MSLNYSLLHGRVQANRPASYNDIKVYTIAMKNHCPLKPYVKPKFKSVLVSPHTTFLAESDEGETIGTIDPNGNVDLSSGRRKKGWNEGFDYGW